jgi:hypothetical protein
MSATDPSWVYQAAPPNSTVSLGTSSLVAATERNSSRSTRASGLGVRRRRRGRSSERRSTCARRSFGMPRRSTVGRPSPIVRTAPLSGSVVQSNAEIYNGWARTSTTLHAFGGAGELLTTTDFPDYVRRDGRFALPLGPLRNPWGFGIGRGIACARRVADSVGDALPRPQRARPSRVSDGPARRYVGHDVDGASRPFGTTVHFQAALLEPRVPF